MYFFKKSVITRIPVGQKPLFGDVAPERDAYLTRWTLFGCSLFTIKVHKIMMSDEACLHDHPWSFLSVILSGGYWEEQFANPNSVPLYRHLAAKHAGYEVFGPIDRSIRKRWYGPGSILWRPLGVAHRLELTARNVWVPVTRAVERVGGSINVTEDMAMRQVVPCWTLVVTLRRRTEWGFFTPRRWVPHGTYTAMNICE